MNNRFGITVAGLVILLVVSVQAVAAQSSPRLTLVDVPIPAFPPIARSAVISGDVHVTVEVRPDGTVASAAVARGAGFPGESHVSLFEQGVLQAARNARFRCEGCGDIPAPHSLVFAFRLAPSIGRKPGDLRPEVVTISPSQTRVLIVAEGLGPPSGPTASTARGRAARCLWLWHCQQFKDPDEGEPAELTLVEHTVPAYPSAARADMASADIEIKVDVTRNGKVASTYIGPTRNLVASTREIETAFQQAAIAAARESKFVCRRCPEGTLPYTLVYAFRFDGVLRPLDMGYAAANPSTPSEARVSVAADVPILDAALNLRTDRLPPTCRLAPGQPSVGDPSVSSNPWSGNDEHLRSVIRERITQSGSPSRYELQLAEGIFQAYVARYVDDSVGATEVYGLLFGDRNDARAFAELATNAGASAFVVHRQIVVGIRGSTRCGDAISGLLKEPARAADVTR